MSISLDETVSRLTSQSDAVGRLAQDSGGFAAVVAAFESKDTQAFRWVLERLEMLPYCELICEWVRIKLCVLRCQEICGPLRENTEIPSLEAFARAIVQLSSNEPALRLLVDAVACGSATEYQAILNQLKLGEFCYLICHWICGVGYRRVCEILCRQEPVAIDAAAEIRATGQVLAGVIANERALAAIGKAALEPNCEVLRSAINQAGFAGGCEIICRLICSWRCVRVCRLLCYVRDPIFLGANGVDEARNFALAFRKLAGQPRALGDLVTAVQEGDAQGYSEIVSRFGLGPFCTQICAWICTTLCHEFCFCVCPPPALQPWFTEVGSFDIYSDIDAATGLTNKALPLTPTLVYGGGPNYAFFEDLQLGGFCPSYSPTVAGAPMQYRFLYSATKTTLAVAINASQTTISVAGGAATPPTPFDVSVCNAGENGETMTVTAIAGTNWTVERGQDGTSPLAAGAGATLWINPAPITGPLVSVVKAGSRLIDWPVNNLGVAGAATTPTFQDVYIYAAPFVPVSPDPPPPAPGTTWTGTGQHYIAADPITGWVEVDLNAVGGGFQTLLGFDTTQPDVAPGGDPIPPGAAIGNPGGAPAGTAVTAAGQKVGTDVTIIFQATRVGAATVDYSNSLCRIHVNNWSEVNNLWFEQFTSGAGCCQPIDDTLSVEFTVDHELMSAGGWSMAITSCSPSAPGDITPPNPTAGVTFTAGGRGAAGTIVENTTNWSNCSYTASLTTRPALTTGLADRTGITNPLTFCICGHKPGRKG